MNTADIPLSSGLSRNALTMASSESTANDSDQNDIALAQQGDVKAFTRLVKRHDDKLRRFVYLTVRNAVDVDDVMQDTYLKAFKSITNYRGDSSFAVWLHRIANNSVIDNARKTSRVVLTADAEPNMATYPAVSADRVDVIEALRQLPEKQRTIVLLVDGHGYDYGSVATVLSIPVGTVAYQLHRARKALRSRLQIIEKEAQ